MKGKENQSVKPSYFSFQGFLFFFLLFPTFDEKEQCMFVTRPMNSLPQYSNYVAVYLRWAGYATIWDFTIKSLSLKMWSSYARKEGKWWNFDKLYSRHLELPGEWAPPSLSSKSALGWKVWFIFISWELPIFYCGMIYSIHLC